MELRKLSDFRQGWIIGNFEPSLFNTKEWEVGVKFFKFGDSEPSHFQKIATEITVVVSGRIRFNDTEFSSGDVIIVNPLEVVNCEILENSAIVCIKFPSLPEDKIVL
jgi:hypothetical protein